MLRCSVQSASSMGLVTHSADGHHLPARQVSLGYSTSESGAAQIYDREALRLRGSAAQLNFPLWSLSDAAAVATAPEQHDPQVRGLCRTMHLSASSQSVMPCVQI